MPEMITWDEQLPGLEAFIVVWAALCQLLTNFEHQSAVLLRSLSKIGCI